MPTIIFDSASPAVNTDVFGANVTMKRYTKGKVARKILFVGIMDGSEFGDSVDLIGRIGVLLMDLFKSPLTTSGFLDEVGNLLNVVYKGLTGSESDFEKLRQASDGLTNILENGLLSYAAGKVGFELLAGRGIGGNTRLYLDNLGNEVRVFRENYEAVLNGDFGAQIATFRSLFNIQMYLEQLGNDSGFVSLFGGGVSGGGVGGIS